jgi:hypothetical protein
VHSDWSYDGQWKLDDIVREFSGRGYQVLMMTEHDRGFTESRWTDYRAACGELSSEKMLVIPGIEYSDPDNIVHILTWGDVPFLGENLPTRLVLEGVRDAGGVAVMAHPSRRKAWQRFDPAWSEYLIGIEAWNRKADVWCPSPDASALLAASGCAPFVGMDFHERRQLFPLAMVLDCPMPLSHRAVVECLRSRRCEPRAFDIALRPGVTEAMQVSLLPLEAARRGVRWIYRRMRAQVRAGL